MRSPPFGDPRTPAAGVLTKGRRGPQGWRREIGGVDAHRAKTSSLVGVAATPFSIRTEHGSGLSRRESPSVGMPVEGLAERRSSQGCAGRREARTQVAFVLV